MTAGLRLVVTTALALGLVTALAEARSAETDARLQRQIDRAIGSYAYLTVFDDVHGVIDQEGIVVLSGQVTGHDKRQGIAARVAVLDGVVGVRNDVGVLPVSVQDTALRYQVARAIYGSQALERYASRRHPPVRILVADGHVTLTGVLPSESERSVAVDLARYFADGAVTDRIRIGHDTGRLVPLD